MLDKILGENPEVRRLQSSTARSLAHIGISANLATAAALAAGIGAGIAFAAKSPGWGILLLAISAVGGITVGGLGPPITRRLGPWRSLLIAGLAMAASQAVLGLTANVIIAAAMLAASSAACVLLDLTATTMRQRQTPDHLLGRITGLYSSVLRSSEALGALGGGLVATVAGIRATMLIGAIPIAATVILLTWHHRGTAWPRSHVPWPGR